MKNILFPTPPAMIDRIIWNGQGKSPLGSKGISFAEHFAWRGRRLEI